MTQDKLNKLIEELIEFGEDKTELIMWKNIFSDLNIEEKTKIIENLEKELKQLKNLK